MSDENSMFKVLKKDGDIITFRICKLLSLRTAFKKMLKYVGYRELEYLRISFDRDYFYFKVRVKKDLDEDTKRYLKYFLRLL